MCEAFNSVILQAHDKPVITLMEMIRVYLMKRLVTERVAVHKWHHHISPKVMNFVEKIKMESSVCNPAYCGNYVFQVKENGGEQFMVNTEQKSCACNKWQLIGILCIHGMAALLSYNCNPLDFIDRRAQQDNLEKKGGTNVPGSEVGNENGGRTQPVQPRQDSSVQLRQVSSHNRYVQPRQASSQNQPVQTQLVQRRQTSTQTQPGKPKQASTQTQQT
ncbi:hypothetical protein Q3G72_021648 [Acer saccharum]|nr:hypothetical protein Q3G72_021648 [Acer saccharum]